MFFLTYPAFTWNMCSVLNPSLFYVRMVKASSFVSAYLLWGQIIRVQSQPPQRDYFHFKGKMNSFVELIWKTSSEKKRNLNQNVFRRTDMLAARRFMKSGCRAAAAQSPADPRQMFATSSSFIHTADQNICVSQLELQNVWISQIKWKFPVRWWGNLFLQHHFLMGSPRGLFLDPLGSIFKKHGVSFHRYADDS